MVPVYNNINELDRETLVNICKENINEMIANMLAKRNYQEKYIEDIDNIIVEIDHENGMVLYKPKKLTVVKTIIIPKSKYYGKKRNKMINTYHNY